MKSIIKFTCIAIVLMSLSACNPQQMARQYGGTVNVNVPKGEKVIEATWKDDGNLWYLTEPMEDDYTPVKKHFRESAGWGVLEGEVIFVESK